MASDQHADDAPHDTGESGELVIHDEEAGIHIEARVEGVPKGAVARRLRPILRLVEYHKFQSKDED